MRGLGAAAVQEKSPLGAPNMSIALVAFLDTSTMFNVDTLSRFEAFGLEGFTYSVLIHTSPIFTLLKYEWNLFTFKRGTQCKLQPNCENTLDPHPSLLKPSRTHWMVMVMTLMTTPATAGIS